MKTLVGFVLTVIGWIILFWNLPLEVAIGLAMVVVGITFLYDGYFQKKGG